MRTFWDERFDRDEYVYGTEPNEFAAETARYIPLGKVLCLGEGEGRNAVFLAEQGYDVTAVDSSNIGLQKAQKLATESGVAITTIHADLAHYSIEPQAWQGIIATFVHVPQPLRRKIHAACVKGLAPGGALILEGFTPQQLEYSTGGPKALELLMTLDDLKAEFHGLDFRVAQQVVRYRKAGLFHTGDAAVVQILGIKPNSL